MYPSSFHNTDTIPFILTTGIERQFDKVCDLRLWIFLYLVWANLETPAQPQRGIGQSEKSHRGATENVVIEIVIA